MSKSLQHTRDDERDTFAQPETRRDENAFCEKMMEEIKAENPAFHSHLKRFSGRVAVVEHTGNMETPSAFQFPCDRLSSPSCGFMVPLYVPLFLPLLKKKPTLFLLPFLTLINFIKVLYL